MYNKATYTYIAGRTYGANLNEPSVPQAGRRWLI